MNKFAVGAHGDRIVILGLGAIASEMNNEFGLSRGDALNLAAYLVALADPKDELFPALLRDVRGA